MKEIRERKKTKKEPGSKCCSGKEPKKSTSFKLARLAVTVGAGFGLIMIFAFFLAYRDKIYPGVYLNQVSVGNKSFKEAMDLLGTVFREERLPSNLILKNEDQWWEIDLVTLGFQYDLSESVKQAWEIGRKGNWFKRGGKIISAWQKGQRLNLNYKIDQEGLQHEIEQIAAQTEKPLVEPKIEYKNGKASVLAGENGRSLNRSKLFSNIDNHLKMADFSPIELDFETIPVNFDENEARTAELRLQKLTGKSLVLKYRERLWEIGPEEIFDLVKVRGGFDNEKAALRTAALANEINRPAQNAVFSFENGRVIEFVPAVKGLGLKEAEATVLLINALDEIENRGFIGVEAGDDLAKKTVELPVEEVEPEITTESVNQMGIRELLAVGRSNFAGSAVSRIHNLTLASQKLNGLLVPPGETFSFNETLGEVSAATGYQSAFVIKEGKTILDDGGGVCQVSTTFFRAILNAGLPVVERHPHSYRVSYYEQGGFGPGLDATVWIPGVDLKFKNDTTNHLLVQTRVETGKKELVFEIYGTGDGRKSQISPVKYWSRTPPPPDLYLDDPTLPAGTVKQTERAIWGAKVSVDWKVTRGEEILQDRTFFSDYKAWQAVYIRGPAVP